MAVTGKPGTMVSFHLSIVLNTIYCLIMCHCICIIATTITSYSPSTITIVNPGALIYNTNLEKDFQYQVELLFLDNKSSNQCRDYPPAHNMSQML